MRCLLFSLACLLTWSTTVCGQIDLPEKVAEHQPVVAASSVDADVYIWRVSKPAKRVTVEGGRKIHIWAPPGEYEVSLTVITIVIDWEKQMKEVLYDEHVATLVIEGDGDDGDDDGPDPTPGAKQFVLIYEGSQLDNMPQLQRFILTSLKARKEWEEAGHRLLEVLERSQVAAVGSDDHLYAFVQAFTRAEQRGMRAPVVVYAPRAGGQPAVVKALPESASKLLEELQ